MGCESGLLRPLQEFIQSIESTGTAAPWLFLALFLTASVLMVWRLEAMGADGFGGTVLGTLVMPYCSGVGNLVFAFVLGRDRGPGQEVMTNALVNNITNMTLLLGLPALIWGLRLLPEAEPRKKKKGKEPGPTHELNRLAMLLTLTAVLFFTGAVWVLAKDGRLDRTDGLILVGLFLFWQCFHVFDVLKQNVQQNKPFRWMLPVNLLLLGVGAYGVYLSIDWLVPWLMKKNSGLIQAKYLGWLSGFLMVIPNALLALYYGWRGQPEVTYSSQVGDGHICIPLCVGIYALYHPLLLPAGFDSSVLILGAATGIHLFFVAVLGRVPRWGGLGLIAGYGWWVYQTLPR